MRGLPFVVMCFACAADAPRPADPCAPGPVVEAGIAELAELGPQGDLVPVLEGQDLELQLGVQGLWMFVLSARARELDVGTGERAGVVELAALDAAGAPVSLELGCRVREFAEDKSGVLQLASPYFLPVDATRVAQLEGARVTLRLVIRDHLGRRATVERTVVAHVRAAAR